MKEYTTQMDAARKGIITPQMEAVARKENMPEKLISPMTDTLFHFRIRSLTPLLPARYWNMYLIPRNFWMK